MSDDIRNNGEIEYKVYTKVDELKIWADLRIGCAYLPRSNGLSCNIPNRTAAIAEYQRSAPQIKAMCPVASGRITKCYGTYDEGKRCRFYDHTSGKHRPSYGPLELITCAFNENGIPLSGIRPRDVLSHASIKYKASIKYLPKHVPFYGIVFNVGLDTGEINRIGLYDGTTDKPNVIYLKNFREGVVKVPFSQASWSHWAFIDGLYSAEETSEILRPAMENNIYENKKPYTAVVDTGSAQLLNIRHQADYLSSIVGQVESGEEVLVLLDYGDIWAKVSYRDTVGYCVRQYLNQNNKT